MRTNCYIAIFDLKNGDIDPEMGINFNQLPLFMRI